MNRHDAFDKLLAKIKPGDLYRIKRTKTFYKVIRRNHSIEVADYDWLKASTITHKYSITLRFFFDQSGAEPKYNSQRKKTVSLSSLKQAYTKVSNKQAKTLKILFGNK